MTESIASVQRRSAPAVVLGDIAVAAPPGLPTSSSALLTRLLPVATSLASMGGLAAMYFSGSALTRGPAFLAFPAMMLMSMVLALVTGRGRGRGGLDADRIDYLRYLSQLRSTVAETVAAQHASLMWSNPDPDTLWTLVGGPRMWERRAGDADFCRVRVGFGNRPLARRLAAPEIAAQHDPDPVTASALRRFLAAHSTVVAPVTIDLPAGAIVTIGGDAAAARGLVRAIVCQLAVLHPPDELAVVAVVTDRNRAQWDWLKWLPHNQHPAHGDAAGPSRMVYETATEARDALLGTQRPRVVVVTDCGPAPIAEATMLAVGAESDGAPVTIKRGSEVHALPCPDQLGPLDAVICARRLAAHAREAGLVGSGRAGWLGLVGIRDPTDFDPVALWRNNNGLRAPIGRTADGAPLELDIKEPAENGMGPHGLCVGATGSGKSELLRTIALGMMARNSPEVLNLLLIDFKGGATFLDFATSPHVAAVITNLAEEAHLVVRMRDALAGEMNRRQQLLRAARCAGVTAYAEARRSGAPVDALPTLFVIVDEFSELLSRHPDFADTFVAIGRLGRSLGIHLLLASQRLDEGRLRGLEAHLSYRICLKTLSAGESRAVLGTLDAYQLPNAPGVGFLRLNSGAPLCFQSAYVSGQLRAEVRSRAIDLGTSVLPFGTRAVGPVGRAIEEGGSILHTVLREVLHRLSGHGPPAHQVWLPPLESTPPLDELLSDNASTPDLTVPIGVVDRPLEQRRTSLMVDLSGAAGNVAIVGAPRSGKSTALRTLITALAATHDPARVQFYCLDFGGGGLASTRTIPHVGAVAGRAEPRLAARIVAECESVVQRRAARDGDPYGDVFLVVDGWASLRHDFEALETSITSVATQGLSFGVHVVLSASRWAEIRPSLKDQIGTRIELRLGDPADSEVDRRAARDVPHDRPGRGLSRDVLHMLIAPPLDDVPRGESVAPPIPLLPALVEHSTVVHQSGSELRGQILLGLEERGMSSLAVDFTRDLHLLILGDNGCGKTAALRLVCREIVRTKTAAHARLLIVDFRRALLGVVESEHSAGYAMSPAALAAALPNLLDTLRERMPPADATQAQLRGRSWWSGPAIYVVVDDYDLVASPAGNPLAAIVEYLPYAEDLGLHLVIARRSAGLERALFDPLLAGLRDLGCMTLTMSRRPDETAPLGSGRPARLPPGRGTLVARRGDEQLVQVAWSPP